MMDQKNIFHFDQTDQKILDLIRENARMSYSEIGSKIGISRVSVKKRMEAMERSGVIKGYHTIIRDIGDFNDFSGSGNFGHFGSFRGSAPGGRGIRYTIDIEAIPEEYQDVVKALRADRELEELYSTTGDCRIHCVGRSRNQSTMESHVNYLFNHTKGIRRISWHMLLSDLKKAEEGAVDGTEEKFQGD